jgi:hypothetical protein
MNMKRTSSNEGTALVVVLSFTLLATLLAAGILLAGRSHAVVAARQLNMEKAMFVAEGGLEQAAQYITAQRGYLPNVVKNSGALGGGTYDYTITKTGWRQYRIDSVGAVNGLRRTVQVARVYNPSFAEYALWMHVNGVIYFIGGEQFFGHVHSNDKMWFSSQNGVGPIFHEIASTAQPDYGGSLDNVVFEKGFKLNAEEGQLADVDFSELRDLAGTLGLVLDGYTQITFNGDKLKITNTRMGWNNHNYVIGQDDLIFIRNSTAGDSTTRSGLVDLMGGQLDGRLSIVTEDDIQINDHITYKKDPRTQPSNNALGLIAKDDVWVTTNAPNNLNIHAAILATGQFANNDGSFGVINYNQGRSRGALNVHGSIAQDVRGAVGTFNSSGPATGYYKNYSFDPRFSTNAPPYYPVVSDKIRYVGWSEGPAS